MGFFESWSSPWGKLFSFINRTLVWILPLISLIVLPFKLIEWFFVEFLGGKVLELLQEVGDAVDGVSLQLEMSSIPVNLSHVACMFPITFFFTTLGGYVACWAVVTLVKWVIKFIPTIG